MALELSQDVEETAIPKASLRLNGENKSTLVELSQVLHQCVGNLTVDTTTRNIIRGAMNVLRRCFQADGRNTYVLTKTDWTQLTKGIKTALELEGAPVDQIQTLLAKIVTFIGGPNPAITGQDEKFQQEFTAITGQLQR